MSAGSAEDEDVNASPLYKDRDEWKDVKPIYNSPAEDAVVCIRHTPSCAFKLSSEQDCDEAGFSH